MEEACFESQEWYSDGENKSFSSIGCTDSQQYSTQSEKQASEASVNAPRFGKSRWSSQQAGNENNEDYELNRFMNGQVLSEMAGIPQSPEVSSLSQNTDIPSIETMDKKYWYVSFKRERATNMKLEKRLERYKNKLKEVSNQVQQLKGMHK